VTELLPIILALRVRVKKRLGVTETTEEVCILAAESFVRVLSSVPTEEPAIPTILELILVESKVTVSSELEVTLA